LFQAHLPVLFIKNSSESLAGRISFIDVFPLTFREFLGFNNLRDTRGRASI